MARSRSSVQLLGEFGDRVRAARLKAGLSQEAAAYEAGLHPTYFSSVERGQRNVGLVNLVRIAHAVGVDPKELVTKLRP